MARRKVGLLGGSFNPAHDGHRHISLLALKRLGLHQIWWLVSPQNPLKPTEGMAGYEDRLESARQRKRHPRIRISDIERQLGTRYTFDTVRGLQQRFPRYQFVWLMGADNLVQIPRWYRWNDIFECIPICVFDRGEVAFRALAGRAAVRYRRHRLRDPRRLAGARTPAWCFLFTPRHPASATEIRRKRGKSGK